MASVWQVWGKCPPSVWNALTESQRKTLERYIDRKIIKPTYRVAYDCGVSATEQKHKRRGRGS